MHVREVRKKFTPEKGESGGRFKARAISGYPRPDFASQTRI
jgi:hypothetical protein